MQRSILRLGVGEETYDFAAIDKALELAAGRLTEASMYLSEDVSSFSEQLTQLLAEDPPEAIAVAKAITTFVEGAGTEAPRRRDRMRQTSVLAADVYRDKIRSFAINEVLSGEAIDMNLYRLQRCLDIRYQVDRNANQATLIESWAVDLQRGADNH